MTDRIDPAEVARLRAELAVLRNRHGLAVLAVRMDMHERLLDTADEAAALRAEVARLEQHAEGLESRNNAALDRLCYMQQEVDARRADLSRKGGQHAPFHGDFAGVSPSALGRIEWHIRAILDALGGGTGPAQYLEAELRKSQEEAAVMAKRVKRLEGLLSQPQPSDERRDEQGEPEQLVGPGDDPKDRDDG